MTQGFLNTPGPGERVWPYALSLASFGGLTVTVTAVVGSLVFASITRGEPNLIERYLFLGAFWVACAVWAPGLMFIAGLLLPRLKRALLRGEGGAGRALAYGSAFLASSWSAGALGLLTGRTLLAALLGTSHSQVFVLEYVTVLFIGVFSAVTACFFVFGTYREAQEERTQPDSA